MRNAYILLVSALLLCGCGGQSNGATEAYLDLPTIELKNLSIEFGKGFSSSLDVGTCYSMVSATCLTDLPQGMDVEFSDMQVVRESNSALYSVSDYGSLDSKMHLQCDIPGTKSFTFVTPSPLSEDNYYMDLKINDTPCRYYLYDVPDSMRKEIKVDLIVDGERVGEVTGLEGKPLESIEWVSDDYVYYCNEWFADKDRTLPSSSETFRANAALYGTKNTILKYSSTQDVGQEYIIGTNYVPKSGTIVVPRTYEKFPVTQIMSGGIYGSLEGLKRIYISANVTLISGSYNLTDCTDLEEIYYEGSEEAWNSANQATLPSKTKVIFNSYI